MVGGLEEAEIRARKPGLEEVTTGVGEQKEVIMRIEKLRLGERVTGVKGPGEVILGVRKPEAKRPEKTTIGEE